MHAEALSSGPAGFEFTLEFEEGMLELAPAIAIIIVTAVRVRQLYWWPQRVFENSLATSKSIHITVLAILKLALAVLWATRASQLTSISVAAAALSFCEILAIGILSRFEHFRNIRPSSLLCLMLMGSIVFDVIRTRTFLNSGFDSILVSLFVASLTMKLSTLFLEAKDKRAFLRAPDSETRTPEETSSLFNRSIFWWLIPFLRSGFSNKLNSSDIWGLDAGITADRIKDRFYQKWQRYSSSKRGHRLARSSFHALMRQFLAPMIPNAIYLCLVFCQPLLIRSTIKYASSDDTADAGNLLVAFAAVYFLIGIFSAAYWHQVDRWLIILRGCLINAIYRKTLTIDISETSTGASIALMSTDVEKVLFGFKWIHEAITGVAAIPVALYMLYFQVGLAVLAPILIVGICTSLASVLSVKTTKMQKAWLEKTQERVQFTSSVIASMRGVKVMGLESRIQDTVAELRSSEDIAAAKWRLNILMGVGLSSISVEASKWLTFILFVIFSYIKHRDDGQVMNVKTLFTSLAILNIVLGRIEIVIQSIPSIVNAFGCLVRIEEFLKNEVKPHENLPVPRKVESLELTTEKMSLMHDHSRESDSGSMEMHRMSLSSHTSFGPIIRIERLSAGYSQTYIPILRDLSLSIFSGQMVMITGPVGSGKSTLLQTLLSETTIYKGSVRINCPNGVAYCAQTPWLVNKSIRDNIIGVSLFEPEWYKQVIQCCALLKDLESYAKGDQTLVGSKGIGLSGGQKQRIALARAVYSRKPILILDDIFSGLDAATEEHIFTKLMGPKGLFRRNGNTVVLATHAVHHLPFADNTLVLSTEGSIQSYETSELPRTNSGLAEIFKYANGKESFYPDEGDNSLNDIDFDSDRETLHEHKPHEEPQQLQKWNSGDETSQSGSELDAFKYYFKSIGWQHSLTFGGLAIAQSILWNALTIWLEHWSSDPDPSKTVFYMSVYTALVLCFITAYTTWLWHCCMWLMSISAINLHTWQLKTMMKGKISYFNTTDVGIITNRFSQDLVHVDMDLPAALINFVESGLMVVGIIGISLVATPWIAIMLPPLSICFYFVARFYLRTSRQLRILEMEAKAPLYTHFQETLMGISTIRAFSWEREFQDENDKLLLTSQQPSYYLTTAQRWFAMILDMVVAVFAFSIVLLVVYLRHMINPGLIGLALLNTVSLSSSLKILIVFYTNLEISLGAIARMREFNQTVPQEDDGAAHSAPAPEWPSRGNVIYRNYAASHTINSDIVLKSINLDVAAGRKLGICGRSGSGKSSMITALFRLLETQGGSISIDGIDISKVSPRILRGRINILSQEPFFLAGTIRENLSYACVSDQHQLYTEELLRALEIVGLKDKVLALEDGLDSELDLDGFLSHGERQLFSLARAILRTSNIIVLDEFTSSVDLETDLKMQRILREHFWDKTILTVAHRLNTIVDYDTVILLDKGNIVEMGNPQELLQRPGSAFKALYDVHEDTSSGSV